MLRQYLSDFRIDFQRTGEISGLTLPADSINTDRLGVTAFVSTVAHIVVILGIGFTVPEIAKQSELSNSLEILLINTPNDEQVNEAEFIAQHDSMGGGEAESVAQSPLPWRPTSDSASANSVPVQAQSEPSIADTELLTLQNAEPLPAAADIADNPATPETPRDLNLSEANTPLADQRQRLIAQISQRWQEYQKRPRRTYLSPSVKSDVAANYMAMWREQVERIGNLNYPERARTENISAELVIDVAINPDGSIEAIKLLRRSSHQFLNDAAIRFIELASPFEPFPAELRENTDIIHITRAFHFLNGELTSEAVTN